MADNVTLPGAGDVVASDDVGGVQYQRVKMDIGGDGVSVPLVGWTDVPNNEAVGLPVRQIGQKAWACSFSDVGSGLVSSHMNAEIMGTGVGASQAGGSLLITTGTTANAEFLARSLAAWHAPLRLRFSTVLSQRIVNNNFVVALADLLLEGASITINSATSITVNWAGHPFTAQNVGQFLQVGGIVGANGVPGRYAIASVSVGASFNLTVAGWPASGSCTATLFGHSYIRTLFNGTTAAAAAVDTQRNGWAAGDSTITVNTTAAPGTIVQVEADGRAVYFSDTLRATSAVSNVTARGSRIESLPDDNLDLYLFIWSFNGTTNPASTTTWTISFLSVEEFASVPVYVQGQRAQGTQNPGPVAIVGTPAVSISGTPAVTANTSGPAAHDSAISGNPLRIAARALTANYTAVATGDVADLVATLVGALVVKPYAIPEADWQGTGSKTDLTDLQIKAQAAAGIRNYVTAVQIQNKGAVATDVVIKDGSTVLWTGNFPASMVAPVPIEFPTPLRGTAATAVNIACLTTGANVLMNAQGFIAP
jgi:hypothetical protein